LHRLALGPWLLCAGWLVLGCSDQRESGPTAPNASLEQAATITTSLLTPGDPLAWVTPAERIRFAQGAQHFDVEFENETGLGPLFNEASCAECHEEPARGGSGDEIEFHATAGNFDGSCNELTEYGGPVFQQFSSSALQPLLAQLKVAKEPVPTSAAIVGLRTSAPLFGLGLLDAVPDDAIKALADPYDRNGDGISGRPNLTTDGRVGRFGRKAVVASLRAFNDGAFRDEMGITSAAVPTEGTFGGYIMPSRADQVADPEINEEALDLTDAFVRLLAPVAPLELTKEAKDGRNLFARINCTGCHVPSLKTGTNPVAALRYREVAAYSDLLLHDLGPELADICRPGASAAEFRTQPLMGLRLLPHFMHDGRAHTVTEAIEAHGGEATESRQQFGQLSGQERTALVAFLNSL
jgi:CxxC motif-containing protein (DUF1111 family)